MCDLRELGCGKVHVVLHYAVSCALPNAGNVCYEACRKGVDVLFPCLGFRYANPVPP